jgi:hypothetical protein
MYHASEIGWDGAEAERAFVKAVRARRRASLLRRLRRCCAECARLAIHSERGPRPRGVGGVREIRLDAITGTVESHRAVQFDGEFRPSPRMRRRWIAVWLAEQRGTGLPPISVTPIGDAYAIRDGHHRVSVARARGAVTITATIT